MKVFRQLKYLLPAFGRIKGMLVIIALVTFLVSLVALLPPYLSKLLFDEGVIANNICPGSP
jgi:ABC-type bacteriocin/lantibiotic exporter with double-glycine peptidase domain